MPRPTDSTASIEEQKYEQSQRSDKDDQKQQAQQAKRQSKQPSHETELREAFMQTDYDGIANVAERLKKISHDANLIVEEREKMAKLKEKEDSAEFWEHEHQMAKTESPKGKKKQIHFETPSEPKQSTGPILGGAAALEASSKIPGAFGSAPVPSQVPQQPQRSSQRSFQKKEESHDDLESHDADHPSEGRISKADRVAEAEVRQAAPRPGVQEKPIENAPKGRAQKKLKEGGKDKLDEATPPLLPFQERTLFNEKVRKEVAAQLEGGEGGNMNTTKQQEPDNRKLVLTPSESSALPEVETPPRPFQRASSGDLTDHGPDHPSADEGRITVEHIEAQKVADADPRPADNERPLEIGPKGRAQKILKQGGVDPQEQVHLLPFQERTMFLDKVRQEVEVTLKENHIDLGSGDRTIDSTASKKMSEVDSLGRTMAERKKDASRAEWKNDEANHSEHHRETLKDQLAHVAHSISNTLSLGGSKPTPKQETTIVEVQQPHREGLIDSAKHKVEGGLESAKDHLVEWKDEAGSKMGEMKHRLSDDIDQAKDKGEELKGRAERKKDKIKESAAAKSHSIKETAADIKSDIAQINHKIAEDVKSVTHKIGDIKDEAVAKVENFGADVKKEASKIGSKFTGSGNSTVQPTSTKKMTLESELDFLEHAGHYSTPTKKVEVTTTEPAGFFGRIKSWIAPSSSSSPSSSPSTTERRLPNAPIERSESVTEWRSSAGKPAPPSPTRVTRWEQQNAENYSVKDGEDVDTMSRKLEELKAIQKLNGGSRGVSKHTFAGDIKSQLSGAWSNLKSAEHDWSETADAASSTELDDAPLSPRALSVGTNSTRSEVLARTDAGSVDTTVFPKWTPSSLPHPSSFSPSLSDVSPSNGTVISMRSPTSSRMHSYSVREPSAMTTRVTQTPLFDFDAVEFGSAVEPW